MVTFIFASRVNLVGENVLDFIVCSSAAVPLTLSDSWFAVDFKKLLNAPCCQNHNILGGRLSGTPMECARLKDANPLPVNKLAASWRECSTGA